MFGQGIYGKVRYYFEKVYCLLLFVNELEVEFLRMKVELNIVWVVVCMQVFDGEKFIFDFVCKYVFNIIVNQVLIEVVDYYYNVWQYEKVIDFFFKVLIIGMSWE